MDSKHLLDAAIMYLTLLPLLTLHEFAHAWTAWKCGDDTAYLQGRVTLNPVAHMDLLGTVILPILTLALGSGFVFGWGKPVPVNIYNLRNRRRDDTLVSVAGPAMNFLIGVVAVMLAKFGQQFGSELWMQFCSLFASTSLVLCFLNLMPVPPLDGSHVVKNLFRISDELYFRISQYGFVLIIVFLNIPLVNKAIFLATDTTMALVAHLVRLV